MKQETIQNYLDQYLPAIKEYPDDVKRTVTLLIKEVERDTRHAACDQINSLYNNVHNLNH